MAKAMKNNQSITAIGRLLPRKENDEETVFDILNAELVKDVQEKQEKPNFENIEE